MKRGEAAIKDIRLIVIVLATGLGAGLLLLFGSFVYPGLSTDSTGYIAPAVLYAERGQLLHYFWPIAWIAPDDPRLLVYPPFFFTTLSSLLWQPTPEAAMLIASVISALSLMLSTVLFYKVATLVQPQLDWFRTVVILASIGGLCAILVTSQGGGRPEFLVTFWFLLGVLASIYTRPDRRWITLGIMLGVIGATHPAGAIASTIIIGLYFAVQYPSLYAMRYLIQTALVALGVFGLAFITGPYSLIESAQALLQVSGVLQFVGEGVVRSWLLSPELPLYGLLVLSAAGCGSYILYRHYDQIGSKSLFFVFLLLLGAILYQFIIDAPRPHYVSIFAPLLFIAHLVFVSYYLPTQRFAKWSLRFVALGILAVSTIGLARWIILFVPFVQQGSTLPEARATFDELGIETHAYVGVSSATWAFFEPEQYSQLCLFNAASAPQCQMAPHAPEFFVMQQRGTGLSEPPDIAEFELIYHNFVPQPVYLLGIKVANTVPGYAFAVYQRDTVSSAEE